MIDHLVGQLESSVATHSKEVVIELIHHQQAGVCLFHDLLLLLREHAVKNEIKDLTAFISLKRRVKIYWGKSVVKSTIKIVWGGLVKRSSLRCFSPLL